MNILNKTMLITGANPGIGRALVEEALRRGAAGRKWRDVPIVVDRNDTRCGLKARSVFVGVATNRREKGATLLSGSHGDHFEILG